jgi:quercetin dioxygenase-like cupin family protein
MPLYRTCDLRRYSDAGPVPRPLSVGAGVAVMLLCLQNGQRLVAPEDDRAETVFTVLGGTGTIREGDELHDVVVGDVVHVQAGTHKALIAGVGTFAVLGVRRMRGRAGGADDAAA